ncbi:hypothetical protein JKP88DRAFT_245645 [Tribonema minus]|uniref:Uncharacterized protein n=1 Tax=Tribonema minus TaxID=303371 RepID=A0A836CDX6_9STRA|nr:hypothetical protein JKP88DRAFT_245645 [Tribonema minus]
MDDCQQQPFEDHQQRLQRIPVDFGQAWQIQLHTLKGAAFHYATRASISKDHDFTGLRVYSGTQALGLFLLKYPAFVTDRQVIELGCGTGALGQLLAQRLRCRRLVLTDGESQALDLARMNTCHANTDCSGEPVAVQQLRWGDAKETAGALARGAFDVCLGADLMYYNIDVRLLLTTALSLIAARSACICGGSSTCSPHSITTCSNAGHDRSNGNSVRPGSSDSSAEFASVTPPGSTTNTQPGRGATMRGYGAASTALFVMAAFTAQDFKPTDAATICKCSNREESAHSAPATNCPQPVCPESPDFAEAEPCSLYVPSLTGCPTRFKQVIRHVNTKKATCRSARVCSPIMMFDGRFRLSDCQCTGCRIMTNGPPPSPAANAAVTAITSTIDATCTNLLSEPTGSVTYKLTSATTTCSRQKTITIDDGVRATLLVDKKGTIISKLNFVVLQGGTMIIKAAVGADSPSLTMQNSSATADDWNSFVVGKDGGAIYIKAGGDVKVKVPISFLNNYATGLGGAVANVGTLLFTETAYFKGNKANKGGALVADYQSTTTFKKSVTFESNKTVKQREASALGTQFYANHGGALVVYAYATITFEGNTNFHKNTANVLPTLDSTAAGAPMPNTGFGGFMFMQFSSATFKAGGNSKFSENEATFSSGALYILLSDVNFDGSSAFTYNKARTAGVATLANFGASDITSNLIFRGASTTFANNIATDVIKNCADAADGFCESDQPQLLGKRAGNILVQDIMMSNITFTCAAPTGGKPTDFLLSNIDQSVFTGVFDTKPPATPVCA